MHTPSTQLVALAKKFPSSLIQRNPSGGGDYVKHSLYVEKLISVLGGFDFEIIEIIRGDVQGRPPDPNGRSERAKAGTPDLHNVIVGCLARLTVTIDGVKRTIVEVGDCEDPHNWNQDGARLKDASSDALKRCSMRIGVGTHLYSGADYRRDRALTRAVEASDDE